MAATKLELTTQVKGILPATNCPTLDVVPTAVANVAMGGNKITGLGLCTSGTDAASKNYVDATAQGLSTKDSCSAATVAALTYGPAVYANGSSGLGATLTAASNGVLIVDGYTPVLGDRILVKNEAAPAGNGIYTVTTLGTGSVKYILTRASDEGIAVNATTGISEYTGAYTFVSNGSANASTGWLCTTVGAITVGTTAINWTQFNGAASYTAGNGISVASNIITAVAASNSGIQVTGSGIGVLLNGSTLNLSSSGIKISSAGVTATELAASAFPAGSGLTGGGGSTVSVQIATRETPSGTINGSNTAFTLAHTPMSGTEQIFLNGQLLDAGGGNDYTISGTSITMLSAPITGDKLRATYLF